MDYKNEFSNLKKMTRIKSIENYLESESAIIEAIPLLQSSISNLKKELLNDILITETDDSNHLNIMLKECLKYEDYIKTIVSALSKSLRDDKSTDKTLQIIKDKKNLIDFTFIPFEDNQPEMVVKSGLRIAETVRDCMNEVISAYEFCEERYEQLTGLQQDLLHDLEWSTFNGSQGYKIAKDIKDCRRERRRCEYEKQSLAHIYEFFKQKGKMKSQLDAVIGDSRRAIQGVKNRRYTPRILKDSTEIINEKAKEFRDNIKWV